MKSRQIGLVVVAAGASNRMLGIDKIWAELDGRPILLHSLQTFGGSVDRTVIVVRREAVDRTKQMVDQNGVVTRVVAGGATRQESVLTGLEALGSVDIAAVHDAARPLAPLSLLTTGVDLVDRYDGAVPALPVADTIKLVDSTGAIESTLQRDRLRRVQTPQVFRAAALRDAHARALVNGWQATDDAFLLEQNGLKVMTFPGDPDNIKITTPQDLDLAGWIIRRRRS